MEKSVRINNQIRFPQVRLIGPDGNQIGVMDTKAALAMAQEEGLDLVEVSPNARPPVCRMMDYGKFKYEQSKRAKAAKKHQKVTQVKEVRMRGRGSMSLKIDEHDYQFKARHVGRFLKDGNKVKVTVPFRGREMAHLDIGRQMLERLASELSEISRVEQSPKMEGTRMAMVLAPK